MESLEELKEINKEHQLLNGELSFKLGKLEEKIAIDAAMFEDSISKG